MIAKERIRHSGWIPPWLRHQHEARYEWVRDLCRGKRVLDAASANAYGSVLIREVAAWVVAMDISSQPLFEAAALGRNGSVHLVAGDVSSMPFPDGSFDVFVSFETIEHLKTTAGYLAEVRRVLRAEGTFVCSTPNRLLVNPGKTVKDRPFNPYHVREFAPAELSALLGAAFSSVELLGQSRFGRQWSGFLRAVGRLSPMIALRLHQLRKLSGILFEAKRKHLPVVYPEVGEAEVLLAICRP